MDIELPADVFLYHGSKVTRCKGASSERSQKIFKDFFGCSPDIAAEIWALLLLYTDFINAKSCPFYFLCGLLLLKLYNTEEQLAGMAGCHPDTFRKWAWYYVHAISYLEGELVRPICFETFALLIYSPWQYIPFLTRFLPFHFYIQNTHTHTYRST